MLRVDVPEQPEYEEKYPTHEQRPDGYILVDRVRKIPAIPAFTKYIGISSIFSLTPCSEEFARAAQKRMRIAPPEVVDIPRQAALPPPNDDFITEIPPENPLDYKTVIDDTGL